MGVRGRWLNEAKESKFLILFLLIYLGYFIHLTDQETYFVPTVQERILSRGYPAEEHAVHTDDNYILRYTYIHTHMYIFFLNSHILLIEKMTYFLLYY